MIDQIDKNITTDGGNSHKRSGDGYDNCGRKRNRDFEIGLEGYPYQSKSRNYEESEDEFGDQEGRCGRCGRDGREAVFSGGPLPTSLAIHKNYYKLEIQPENNHGQVEWFQYHVEIQSASRKKVFNEDWSLEGYIVAPNPKNGRPIDLKSMGAESTRNILKTLATDNDFSLASDGNSNAFAPSKLFEEHSQIFSVKMKKGYNIDEEDADLVQNEYFLVKLSFAKLIVPTDINQETNAVQAIDAIIKSGMNTVGMKVFEKEPYDFYLPENVQPDIINCNMFQAVLKDDPNIMPVIGVNQAVKYYKDGNAYVNTQVVVGIAHRGFRQLMNKKIPVKILDELSGTICGIKVDLHNYIVDTKTKTKILEKLENMSVNVKFTVPMTRSYLQRMREKGRSDAEIERLNIKVRKNKCLENKMKIIWGANDETLFSFRERQKEDNDIPPKKYTVFSYFQKRYNITLKYPKMPIVSLGNREWFPIEFLYQRFSTVQDTNGLEQVKAVRACFKEHAGTAYVENVSKMAHTACDRLQHMGVNMEQILHEYNLHKSFVRLETRVLPG